MTSGRRAIGMGRERGNRDILENRGIGIRGTENPERKGKAEIEIGVSREKGGKVEREKVESEGKEGKRGQGGLETGPQPPQNPSPSRTSTWTRTFLIS
jgi:hypothetical protein